VKRQELNAKAAELGIPDPDKLGTKADVQAAIAAAAKPPTSLADGTTAFVISVFKNRTLIEVPTETAAELFGQALGEYGRTHTIEAVERDIADIAKRDSELAESGMAAAALRMAYELENPWNSATSKAQCAKSMRELLEALLERAGEAPTKDGVDALSAEREARLTGGSATAD
jgi:hypothetical protein